MNANHHRNAEEFDLHVDDLLAGSPNPGAGPELADELTLATELVAMAKQAVPDAGFASRLERRILQSPRRSGRVVRSTAVRRWVYAAASTAALAAVVLLAIRLFADREVPGGGVIARDEATPTALPHEGGTSETPAPQELPMVPSLAAVNGRGFGGSGGLPPTELVFVLQTSLPQGPPTLMVYSQGEESALTLEAARGIAAKLGLAGRIYKPLWMADTQAAAEVGRSSYIVIDGSRQLVLEGSELWILSDFEGSPFYNGHFNAPAGLPGEQEAIEIASDYLEQAGLLQPASIVRASGNTVSFFASASSGLEVIEPYALVSLSEGGKVGGLRLREVQFQALGDYPLRTAEEAYAIITAGEPSDQLWFSSMADPLPWGEFGGMNPTYWARVRGEGQRADLFGDPFILLPTAGDQSPYVQLDQIELRGMQEEIAEHVRSTGAPVHVWGTIEKADGYQILNVAGWEAGQESTILGVVRRADGEDRLHTDDGQVYILPDLPESLPDEVEVFVEGGLIGTTLEWDLIQERPDPAPGEGRAGGAAPVSPSEGAIEAVELVYLPVPFGFAPQMAEPGVDYRAIQPVWRFRGQDDRGDGFEIYVQAVVDEAIWLPLPGQ